ncbi:MAG: hypothetical protein ACXV5Q_02615 [Frankiaceae bacterium]
MTSSTTGHPAAPPAAAVGDLRASLRGELVLPADAGYDELPRLERFHRPSPRPYRALRHPRRRRRRGPLRGHARAEGGRPGRGA